MRRLWTLVLLLTDGQRRLGADSDQGKRVLSAIPMTALLSSPTTPAI